MQHIDEHTLELFVLGSTGVAKRRQEIEAHIAECHGCRELVEQIFTFYKEAGMEFGKQPKDAPVSENALVRTRNELKPVFEPINSPPIPYKPITVMQKFYSFTRRHPIAVGSTSFACLAVLALSLNSFFADKQQSPRYVVADERLGTVKIVTADHAVLWEWATENVSEAQVHNSVEISDLDNDGVNEVLTTIRLGESRPEDIIELKVFDAKRNLLLSKNFSRAVSYPGRKYSSAFTPGSVLVRDFSRISIPEVIVQAQNVPRSPSIIVRLDSKGNELGAFWHFGALGSITSIDLNRDGWMEIFAGGVNDLADTVSGEFATLVVLDPRRIVDQKRASIATVLDLPLSDAELYYLRFPISSLDSAMHGAPAVQSVQDGKDNNLYVSVGGGSINSQFQLDYVFDRKMYALEVKSNNRTDRINRDLLRTNKITSLLDRAYLENLRQGVRYWDGEKWAKEPKMVRHKTE